MRFSVKVAPGVRIGASSRGLRAHVGPRAARLHVGAGRSGFSTGAGPVSLYTTLGGGGRSSGATRASKSSAASPSPGTGTVQRQLAAAAKAEEGAEIAAALTHLSSLHHARFLPAAPPQIPAPVVTGQEQILATHLTAALRGISIFQRKQRQTARESARWDAYHEINARYQAARRAHDQAVLDANHWWSRLRACDPDTVWDQLARAFADNEAAAAPLNIHAAHADLAVLLPPISALPDKMPGVTEAGNASLRKMTKTQTALWYQVLTCGFVLATASEAFAVAPGLTEVTLVALRPGGVATKRATAECILAATITRHAFNAANLAAPESPRILSQAASSLLINPKGRVGSWEALDLRDEPDLQAVVDSVDLNDLA
jgi:hypothetical protein